MLVLDGSTAGMGESKLRRAEGGPRQPPSPGQCLAPRGEGKAHELVFAAEQIFLLPLSKPESVLLQPALRAFKSNGLELWVEVSSATLTRWAQSEDCWARSEGTADVLSLSSGPHHLDACHGLQGLPSSPFAMGQAELSFYI